jgi:hypothetical protein
MLSYSSDLWEGKEEEEEEELSTGSALEFMEFKFVL